MVSDNKGNTRDGSGVRIIGFRDAAKQPQWAIYSEGERVKSVDTGKLRDPRVMSGNADRFCIVQEPPPFGVLGGFS